MESQNFTRKLIDWYAENKRDLPWRNTKDPYRIWLSEIILQQTRVAQGLPYYERFIEQFPTVEKLAKASEQKILRVWQGLGYYSRARNLHACAKEVVKRYHGQFPEEFNTLLQLPGIGSYTAAAISSIAFNKPVAVVDGNVFRVLSRVFGVEADITTPAGKSVFQDQANKLIDKTQPGLYNQALMEFGALHCTPKKPNCNACFLKPGCYAFRHDAQSLLPVKGKKTTVRNRYFLYVVIQHGQRLAMRKRSSKDIWKGLYDFFLLESPRAANPQKLLEKNVFIQRLQPYQCISITPVFKHVLSHQVIRARFAILDVKKESKKNLLAQEALKFYSHKTVESLPKPVLVSRFLAQNHDLE